MDTDATPTQPSDTQRVSAKKIIRRIGERVGVQRLSAFLQEHDPKTREFIVMVAQLEIAEDEEQTQTEADIVQPERMHDVLREGLTKLATGLNVSSGLDVWHMLRAVTKKAAQEEVEASFPEQSSSATPPAAPSPSIAIAPPAPSKHQLNFSRRVARYGAEYASLYGACVKHRRGQGKPCVVVDVRNPNKAKFAIVLAPMVVDGGKCPYINPWCCTLSHFREIATGSSRPDVADVFLSCAESMRNVWNAHASTLTD